MKNDDNIIRLSTLPKRGRTDRLVLPPQGRNTQEKPIGKNLLRRKWRKVVGNKLVDINSKKRNKEDVYTNNKINLNINTSENKQ